MLTIRQDNARTEIIRYAYKVNNWFDCDVVMDAVKDMNKADNAEALHDAISYLLLAIDYRSYLAPELAKEMTANILRERIEARL